MYVTEMFIALAVTATLFALALMGNAIYYHSTVLKRVRSAEQAYKFYAMRDQWVGFVLEGKLRPGDGVFDYIYDHVNGTLGYGQDINFWQFIHSVLRMQGQRSDGSHMFHQELAYKDASVRRFVVDYFELVATMILRSSWIVRRYAHGSGSKIRALCHFIEVFKANALKEERAKYRAYTHYKQQAADALAVA